MKKTLFFLTLVLFVLITISCDKKTQEKPITVNKTEPVSVEENTNTDSTTVDTLTSKIDSIEITHKVKIKTTMGDILIGLYGKDAPKTVENFVGLVKKGYYNGILFHRVAKGFLIQTGDRNTKYRSKREKWGKGGESFFGHPFEDELYPETISYQIGYEPGTVAMANRGPNTNTSQFFICLEEARDLDKNWTIFGRVLEGMDVVRAINDVEITPGPFEPNDGMPVKPVRIIRMKLQK